MIAPHTFKLSEIAKQMNLKVIGDGEMTVSAIAVPEHAARGSLCVIWDVKALKLLPVEIPIVGRPEFFHDGRSGIAAEDPRAALARLFSFFIKEKTFPRGVHPSACVAPSAKVDPEAWVGPNCTVESGAVIAAGAVLQANVFIGQGVRVGEKAMIEPNATLMDGVKVGKSCLLHANCAIGCDGFGFVGTPDGVIKIPQTGSVTLGDNVEVGAGSTIDRGTIGDTVIGDGTKIDNHVQIGHNVQIGRFCIICAMAGVAGSSVIEDGVTVSAQCGISDHVRVGERSILGGRSGVTNDIPPGSLVSGFPARPHAEARKAQVLTTRLPELYERLRRLEKAAKAGAEEESCRKHQEG